MRRMFVIGVIVFVVGGLGIEFLLGTFVHFDHVRGVWGVSVGTDTAYCSVENVGVSCQVGG